MKNEKKLRDITSSLCEGLYVLNPTGGLLFMNPEAERVLGWSQAELTNKNIHDVFHNRKPDGTILSAAECPILGVISTGAKFISTEEVFTRKDGEMFPVAVSSSPLLEEDKIIGSVTAFRDISEIKKSERERSELIAELQLALEKVKLLSGLLPICASCKKIRDDKGYWNQIESYIREHSEAQFTHGICPECAKEYFGDFSRPV